MNMHILRVVLLVLYSLGSANSSSIPSGSQDPNDILRDFRRSRSDKFTLLWGKTNVSQHEIRSIDIYECTNSPQTVTLHLFDEKCKNGCKQAEKEWFSSIFKKNEYKCGKCGGGWTFFVSTVNLRNVSPEQAKEIIKMARDAWPCEANKDTWDGALVTVATNNKWCRLSSGFKKGDEAVVEEKLKTDLQGGLNRLQITHERKAMVFLKIGDSFRKPRETGLFEVDSNILKENLRIRKIRRLPLIVMTTKKVKKRVSDLELTEIVHNVTQTSKACQKSQCVKVMSDKFVLRNSTGLLTMKLPRHIVASADVNREGPPNSRNQSKSELSVLYNAL
jgi:hypothetical protein